MIFIFLVIIQQGHLKTVRERLVTIISDINIYRTGNLYIKSQIYNYLIL